jgi:hypothetical protein
MNPAYKHLRERLRIGELTVAQMVALFAGFMGGLVFALYLSPFSPYLTLCLAIYIACIPAGSVILASTTEFDVWLYFRAVVRDGFSDGRYMAGPGEATGGYVIDADSGPRRAEPGAAALLDLEELWR